MNARVLELIKNPELFQNQDLDILNSEIKKHPYIQNIRALHLYGIHKFNPENYQKELSTTAAYTTDKKILYQFINKKPIAENVENQIIEVPVQKIVPAETPKSLFNEIEIAPIQPAKPVYVNGDLNRILFEGEEDFLERENPIIDLESTIESGIIVTQNTEKESVINNVGTEKTETFTPETIVNEVEISKEEAIIENNSELSFHGMDEFLPEIKINPNTSESKPYNAPKQTLSKHEEEMQRLIADVEAKMKTSKKEKVIEEETHHNTDLNFSETQNFEAPQPKVEISTKTIETDQKTKEIAPKPIEIVEKPTETEKSDWKPMSFSGNIPDSLINKKTEIQSEEKIIQPEKTVEKKETVSEEKTEERPVFNVSFFAQKVSSIESEKVEKPIAEIEKPKENIDEIAESNIPVFINTWQNWLKIDRNQPKTEEIVPISKDKVIEDFIVKEPRISKLKEESDFVVKEKGDNISHLMTETLAKLYTEQKLYSKAIKAYQILSEKHPEKTEIFNEKIQEIKDIRSGNK